MEEKKYIKLSLKKFIFIIIVMFIVALMATGAILLVVNQGLNKNTKEAVINKDSDNVRIRKLDGEKYYIIKDEYDGDYDLQYTDLTGTNNPAEFEVEEVMSFTEYKSYCREWDLDINYSDKNMNYIVFSYLSYGAPNLEAKLIDVVYKNKKADIYLWDDATGISADLSAYVLVIPTENEIRNINIIPTYTDEEFEELRNPRGFTYDPRYPMEDKPIIYLYPTEETEIKVDLLKDNNITCSYPKYNDEWNVLAKPNGDLIDLDTNKELYALYYECKNDFAYKIEKDGFVVKGEDSAGFLEEKLLKLGLTSKEAEEFIVYWLPKLEKNKYNYIRFANEEEINQNMPMEISPRPDNVIRVMMTYKGLNEPINVEEQILETPKRNGFVLVEWGGSEIK